MAKKNYTVRAVARNQATADRLQSFFKCDPKSGELWCKVEGCLNTNGYTLICMRHERIYAHILIWLLHYGQWPDGMLDHINGNRSDNRIENLRIVTHSQNAFNRATRSDSASGHVGVHYLKRLKKWSAYIQKDGVQKTLGTFNTKEEAVAARRGAAARHHGEYARYT